ncbi:MAG: UDP-N-acetylmuramoyl-L-alanyl-D-glutamate--2,6-diaminopimelate ligase [Ruminococcaceae bacterium]|nr:UDP-N-acetylmuramoyl-L-alanyl-D-glutamate--2,6-diaminopimelate ligase [Oscillospiraceae bacterium]
MILSEILKGVEYKCNSFIDLEINDIAYDSRKAGDGIIFVCLKGAFADGHKYAASAYEKGSRVFICSDEIDVGDDSVIITVEDTRACLAEVSCNFFRHPSKELAVIGITGTKGKTTVAHIVKSVLDCGGMMTGIIGTVGARFGDIVLPTVNTTPESYELQKMFRQMVDGGCKAVAIEVSSLGLKSHRTDGTEFTLGIFTNLYPDHIGTNEHESFEEYAYWKTRLFPLCQTAIVNADDPFAPVIIQNCKGETITYGECENADYRLVSCEKIKFNNKLGMSFTCLHSGKENKNRISLPGDVNASNALVALAVADFFGIGQEGKTKGLESVFVKGRGEMLSLDSDFTVIIDYAHNGVSLKSIIDTAKAYEHNRVITLFGSVGGRTECRRQELGSVSGALSDLSIITSDDPNFEDPRNICEEIAESCKAQGGEYVIIPDRAEAIEYAIMNAQKGDIIILAGKGHEETMKICGENIPFVEKDEVFKAMAKRG